MSPRSTSANALESFLDWAASLANVRFKKDLRAADAHVWSSKFITLCIEAGARPLAPKRPTPPQWGELDRAPA